MVKNNSRRYLSVFLSLVMVMSAVLSLPVSKASACDIKIEDTLNSIINKDEGYETFLGDMERVGVGAGGHTLERHVGKDEEYLKNRLVEFNQSYNRFIEELTRREIKSSEENEQRKLDFENLVVSNEGVEKYLSHNNRVYEGSIKGLFVEGLLEYFCSIDYPKEKETPICVEDIKEDNKPMEYNETILSMPSMNKFKKTLAEKKKLFKDLEEAYPGEDCQTSDKLIEKAIDSLVKNDEFKENINSIKNSNIQICSDIIENNTVESWSEKNEKTAATTFNLKENAEDYIRYALEINKQDIMNWYEDPNSNCKLRFKSELKDNDKVDGKGCKLSTYNGNGGNFEDELDTGEFNIVLVKDNTNKYGFCILTCYPVL